MRTSFALSLVALAIGPFVAPRSTFSAESYRFTSRLPKAGQQMTQEVSFDLDMKTTIEQAGQTIATSDRKIERKQRRKVTVLKVAADRVTEVRITYEVAEQTFGEGGESGQPEEQPVAHKTYLVSRGEAGLVVTDEQGQTPPADELAIVAASMDSIGRVNPIAKFFHGRTIAVGETIRLPNQLAQELLGMGEGVSGVSRFELTLSGTRQVGTAKCAVFQTEIESKSGGDMSMKVDGELVMEIDTCRAVEATFSGPVAVTQERGPVEAHYNVSGQGTIHVGFQIKDAPRKF